MKSTRRAFSALSDDQRCRQDITLRTDKSAARCMRRAVEGGLCRQHAAMVGVPDWLTPTTYRERFADAVERLCGRRAPEDMVDAWLTPGCDDGRLQEFAVEHGPAWAQGIVLLDAAHLMAENPAEAEITPRAPLDSPLLETDPWTKLMN